MNSILKRYLKKYRIQINIILRLNYKRGVLMSKAKVFVIMPFSDEFFESYEMIKTHFQNDFDFSHAGDEDNQQNILADIISPIYNADVVIADLTGLDANVMYELGIAHSFNKKTIVITRDDVGKLPFDLKQYRARGYSTHFKQFFDLLSYLDKHLHGAVDGSVVFNNPVSDFLVENNVDPHDLFTQDKIDVEIPDGEKGFIDFLAEIEEDTNSMTKDVQDMSANMKIMNAGIKECTSEIQRINSTSGSGKAAFIRKQTKKVANHMSTFSSQLKAHNDNLNQLWSKIEYNILGLIETKIASQKENRESLVTYLKALHGMQEAIKFAHSSINNLKESTLNNLGIERSLNQSIRFLVQDLEIYLTISEQMIAAIDRIMAKSKFVVGEINFE